MKDNRGLLAVHLETLGYPPCLMTAIVDKKCRGIEIRLADGRELWAEGAVYVNRDWVELFGVVECGTESPIMDVCVAKIATIRLVTLDGEATGLAPKP